MNGILNCGKRVPVFDAHFENLPGVIFIRNEGR